MKRAMERTVIWYIDIEHQRTASVADFETYKRANIEAAAPGCSVEYTWYGELVQNPAGVTTLKADDVLAWLVSGNTTEWSDYVSGTPPLATFEQILVDNTEIPMIAACGGHEIMAAAFGGGIAHMTGCPTNPDCEFGKTLAVDVLSPSDPLFAGLPLYPQFVFYHHDEVAVKPVDFQHLARTAVSELQVLKHKYRVIYSTQFHPELGGPQGGDLLTNFFTICNEYFNQ